MTSPALVHTLVLHLRRRRLPLGVDDVAALRQALSAGFGLASTAELRNLCVALWAKSPGEAELVRAAFAQLDPPAWDVGAVAAWAPPAYARRRRDPRAVAARLTAVTPPSERTTDGDAPAAATTDHVPAVTPHHGGPALAPPGTGVVDPALVLVPRYPVSDREVAQTWRRLRRPMRQGPPVELDLDATVDRYAHTAVATAPVLRPARRNTARLLLLLDRLGSMTPFHPYVDHIHDAIRHAARIDAIVTRHFHDVPGRSRDQALLAELPDPFAPVLDPVLDRIGPLTTGRLYVEPDLTGPLPLTRVLDGITAGTAIAVFSDGGATRGQLDTGRLLDTVALLVALRARGALVAWLNPLPPDRWAGSTAGQIARHVPMFPLTREGMYRAVDVLRGRPPRTERPL